MVQAVELHSRLLLYAHGFRQLRYWSVVWGDTMTELGYIIQQNTWGFGLNTLGLAFGCILFITFALKYGRRPVYIISAAVDLATAIWQAKMRTVGDLYGSNVVSGLAGAISGNVMPNDDHGSLLFGHRS